MVTSNGLHQGCQGQQLLPVAETSRPLSHAYCIKVAVLILTELSKCTSYVYTKTVMLVINTIIVAIIVVIICEIETQQTRATS